MHRIELSIELLEDLHVGTGTGWGDIDSLQVRDRHGAPVLPASHLKGVLRACALEWQRSDPAAAISRSAIERLFGRAGQGQGRLQLGSGYLVRSNAAPGAAASAAPLLVWGSTQIAPSGTAQDESLRQVEYVPAGTRFVAHCTLSPQGRTGAPPAPQPTAKPEPGARPEANPNPNHDPDLDLLRALLARCTHLGAERTRGAGRVRWGWGPAPEAKPLTLGNPPSLPARLRLLLRNPEPICLPRTGHPGNNIETEAYIRARALRGAVVAACLALGDEASAQQLLQPHLAWGDALPLPPGLKLEPHLQGDALGKLEVLPLPLSIGTPKAQAEAGALPWWASAQVGDTLGASKEVDQLDPESHSNKGGKLKRPQPGEFVCRATPGSPWRRYQPQRLERLRTSVPCADNAYEQALFCVESIAEGTCFVADLIVTQPAQRDILQRLVPRLRGHWLRVGRGGQPLLLEAATWLPMPKHNAASAAAAQPAKHGAKAAGASTSASSASSATSDSFTLLLQSDLIARDAYGNFLQRLDAAALARLAGLGSAEGISIEQQFSEGCDIYGFNASTGLPRLALHGIKAGSALRVQVQALGTLPEQAASRLRTALAQRPALGELPEEGFGRFRLHDLPKPSNPAPAPAPAKPPATAAAAKPAAAKAPLSAASSAEDLCAQARDLAHKLGSTLHQPSNSQWGEARSRWQAARTWPEVDAVFDLLQEASKKHGGKAWAPLVNNPAWAELRQHLAQQPLAQAQELLEYLLRWQRALNTTDPSRGQA